MQSQTEIELDHYLQEKQSFVGGELIQLRFDEKVLQLQFQKKGKFLWLTFSFKPGTPYLFFTEERIHLVKSLKKPLALFLKTHFIGEKLTSMKRDQEKGRVLVFSFLSEAEAKEIQLHLIPGRVNVEAHFGPKSVYAMKPKEIPEAAGAKDFKPREPRSSEFFLNHWEKSFSKKNEKSSDTTEKELKKKRSGLKKMQSKLQESESDHWKELGDWLKQHQSFEGVPPQWEGLVDPSLGLAACIERCFKMSKKNRSKLEGTLDRIKSLKQEIADLESGNQAKPKKKQAAPNLLAIAELKGKTQKLDEGRIFIGKSGPENLKLLRKAKPWYLWLHIKDYPGAFGIVEKNKGKNLSGKSLQQASLAVVRQSLPKGAQGVFDVIYTECRYVRPIKGAKSGQVTYSHEKVLSIKVEE